MNVTQIFETFEDFDKRKNKSVNGVSPDFVEKYPNWVEMNLSNKGCWDCVNCAECDGCFNCIGCKVCHWCHACFNCHDCICSSFCIFCCDCFCCDNYITAKGIVGNKRLGGKRKQ